MPGQVGQPESRARLFSLLYLTSFLQVASAAPIGAVGRPNRGGAYETGSDGAAGGPPGARRVPTGPRRARGAAGGSRMGPYINRAPIRDHTGP